MKPKKFSALLIEARKALELSADTMAFILEMEAEMYKRYERGQFDGTWSVRKDRILEKIDSIDLEIEKKILFLKRVLRNYRSPNGAPQHKKQVARN